MICSRLTPARAVVAFAVVAFTALGWSSAADPPSEPRTITVRKRMAVPVTTTETINGMAVTVTRIEMMPIEVKNAIDPKRTAVIVCDMWDDHWCKAASVRCAELAKQADPVLKAARAMGMTIIHAPSDTMKFYVDHPARKRTLAVTQVEPPKAKELPSPALPVDDSDGGCDDDQPAKQFRAWSRQHAAITIDDAADYISDNGTEVYSVMASKKITTLIVMGVHTNMCVLNRSFAIKQMTKWGVKVYLVRDLTDAMYNPKMKPMVTHAKGTELIVEHIETHWCPTMLSQELLGKK